MTQRAMNEKQIQSAVIAYWRRLGKPQTMVAAIPNARAFGQPGLTKGLPDLLVIAPGLPIGLLELKAAKGRLRPDQRHILALCETAQAPSAVAYSVDEAITVLERWGAVRPIERT